MQWRGPPKGRKKNIEASCESTIVPFQSTPRTMHFPSNQGASASLGTNPERFGHGSNHPEALSIEYPVLSLGTTTTTTSMPTKDKKKAKGKAKAQGKTRKNKVSVAPDSPAMSTRSRTPQRQSPAAHTRSKRKLPDLNM